MGLLSWLFGSADSAIDETIRLNTAKNFNVKRSGGKVTSVKDDWGNDASSEYFSGESGGSSSDGGGFWSFLDSIEIKLPK